MRLYVLPLLATMCAFPSAQGNAQSIPLTATKTRITYAITPGGAVVLQLEERGNFARDSAGDEATRLKVIREGRTAPGSGVINRREEGLSYVIDEAHQRYKVVPWPQNGARPRDPGPEDGPVVTRAIDGIECVAVHVQNSDGKVIGTDWVSRKYAITVRAERDLLNPQTGLAMGLVVEELTDIRIGTEPDTAQFAIPAGYKQVGGSGPS